MSWIKAISLALFCLISSVQAEPSSWLYQCPAQLQLHTQSHTLKGATVFDGPIEERATLVPEFIADAKQSAHWEAYQQTLYVKCRYQDTRHYIVLEAEGAKQCIQDVKDSVVRVQCK